MADSASSVNNPKTRTDCPYPGCKRALQPRGLVSHLKWHQRRDAADGIPYQLDPAKIPDVTTAIKIDLGGFEGGKLPAGDDPLKVRTLVRKRLELVAIPAVILVLAVVRFEATLMWLMWPAVAIGAGGMAWYSVLQARSRIVWTFRRDGNRAVLWGSNWMKADAEKLPEAAKFMFGSQPEWWIDDMGESTGPIAFDPLTAERPSHVIPSLVARNIHQQDVHTFSQSRAARKSQNLALGVYGFIAAALLVFIFAVIDRQVGGGG